MKKVLAILSVLVMLSAGVALAGGDKNRGDKGQGSTGSDGGGTVTQTRGN